MTDPLDGTKDVNPSGHNADLGCSTLVAFLFRKLVQGIEYAECVSHRGTQTLLILDLLEAIIFVLLPSRFGYRFCIFMPLFERTPLRRALRLWLRYLYLHPRATSITVFCGSLLFLFVLNSCGLHPSKSDWHSNGLSVDKVPPRIQWPGDPFGLFVTVLYLVLVYIMRNMNFVQARDKNLEGWREPNIQLQSH